MKYLKFFFIKTICKNLLFIATDETCPDGLTTTGKHNKALFYSNGKNYALLIDTKQYSTVLIIFTNQEVQEPEKQVFLVEQVFAQ